jgi:hypothetical protein
MVRLWRTLEKKSWDEDLIKSLFFDVDGNRILQIPLNSQGFKDFVAWGFTKHGQYSIRLAMICNGNICLGHRRVNLHSQEARP